MTSSLLKKRRTIRQNTLGAIDARRAAAGLVALLLAFVLAGDLHAAPWQEESRRSLGGRPVRLQTRWLMTWMCQWGLSASGRPPEPVPH